MRDSRLLQIILSLPQKTAILGIVGYQKLISPLFPPACRFTPTCSSYALTSIQRYGLLKGGWLAVKRIGRCHPFNPGGHDPVP